MKRSRDISSQTSLEDLAHIVYEQLESHGIDAVLTGGAVISIYSANRYQSYDLDFVAGAGRKELAEILAPLGFADKGGRHFTHPDCPFEVEFPGSVAMLGGAFADSSEYFEHRNELGTLRLLSPTQAVMDRLAAFYHWGDPQSLEQALMVASSQVIDLDAVESWSSDEGASDKFGVFRNALEQGPEE
jgi:hypothetical protein